MAHRLCAKIQTKVNFVINLIPCEMAMNLIVDDLSSWKLKLLDSPLPHPAFSQPAPIDALLQTNMCLNAIIMFRLN